jgi:hypothetical protein
MIQRDFFMGSLVYGDNSCKLENIAAILCDS